MWNTFVELCSCLIYRSQKLFRIGVGLDAYFPVDKLEFETLQVQFLVDEDMANFTELYNWMTSIVPLDPTNYDPGLKMQKQIHLIVTLQMNF